MNKMSPEQCKALLNEVFDADRVMLLCGTHQYLPGGKKRPTMGCKDCMQVFYINLLAKVPPHLRQERIEQLEAMVHHIVEELKMGILPPVFDRAEISSPETKDVN